MTDPQLFGRPSNRRSVDWPPAATNTSSGLSRLEVPERSFGVRFDWKFFAVAAVLAAIVIAVLFAFSDASAGAVSGLAGRPMARALAASSPWGLIA